MSEQPIAIVTGANRGLGLETSLTVEDGARGIVWAATLPDDGPSGGFFRHGEPIAW